MNAAIELADRLDVGAVLQMHNELLSDSDPRIAGRWRTEQVWIGHDDLGPVGADFIPPQHTRVAEAMTDLVAFMQRDDLPVLAQATITHAQFETIHPFVDGNGRTGRALIHSLLRAKGLTRHITIPVSAGLLTDVDAYFDALTAYRNGDPGPIVGRLTDATFAAMNNGRHLVDDLRQIRSTWAEKITARRDSRVHTVADLIVRQPVVNAQYLADKLGIAQSNVYPLIEQLVGAGVLTATSDRRRGRTWRSIEVIAALDEFARRAGRRHRAT
jgi:Fic family protein